jgi:2-polyprenyl-6-methoxyphenol hydroxylase-like FAD-dependent oxidoreductase
MHAIRDALNLAEALSHVSLENPISVASTVESYQREALNRGHEAVRLSRNAHKNNQQARNMVVAWGYVAKPTAEENVLLEKCKP